MKEETCNRYLAPKASLWKGRKDSLQDERLFQSVNCVDMKTQTVDDSQDFVLIGFACDEGVIRNLGRPGAALGPRALRESLGSLALQSDRMLHVADVGDISCADSDLEKSQSALADLVSLSRSTKAKTIVLGGGHETAYGHYLGLGENTSPDFGIINIDAHFDMRPLVNGKATSGTPFVQIAEHRQANRLPFNYCCVGVQYSANTRSIRQTAQKWGAQSILAESIHAQGIEYSTKTLDSFMKPLKHIYLTICLDAIASCYAPGVSAPQVYGLLPWHVRWMVRHVAQSGKMISADIVEYSPAFDHDNRTAQLAAGLVSELLV